MEIIKEGYIKLTEASLNRLTRGHDSDGYAILSASRNENSAEQNNKNFSSLKKDVKSMGYSFVPVFGGYIETDENGGKHQVYEKSLYVLPMNRDGNGDFKRMDFEEFVDNMFELGSNYKQEQILIKYPDSNPAYYDVKTRGKDLEFSGDTSFNNIGKEFFTSMKKWDGGNKFGGNLQRFSFNECYLSEQPHTVAGYTVRSLNGELVYFNKRK